MRRLLYFSLSAAALSGCGSDPGAIEVRWNIGALNDCGEEGIVKIRITLHEESGATEGPFVAECDAGTTAPFTLNDVAEGAYTITLEGLDAADNVIFTGESAARYNVSEGKTTQTDPVQLNPAPPSIRVLWRFADGRPCASHAVTQVEAKAFLGAALDATETAPCDSPEIVLQDSRMRPTPEGEGEGYDVQVNGKDASGTTVFRFTESDVALAPAGEAEVDGILEDCAAIENGCP